MPRLVLALLAPDEPVEKTDDGQYGEARDNEVHGNRLLTGIEPERLVRAELGDEEAGYSKAQEDGTDDSDGA